MLRTEEPAITQSRLILRAVEQGPASVNIFNSLIPDCSGSRQDSQKDFTELHAQVELRGRTSGRGAIYSHAYSYFISGAFVPKVRTHQHSV